MDDRYLKSRTRSERPVQSVSTYYGLAAPEIRRVRSVVDDLVFGDRPRKAIGELVEQSRRPGAGAFERYAGMALDAAGARVLCETAPLRAMRIVPPSDGKLARIELDAPEEEIDAATLEDVENAVNRLMGMADALEEGFVASSRAAGGARMGISLLGSGFLPDKPGYRSAYVKLPPVPPTGKADTSFFNEVDWRVVDHVASNSHTIFQNCLRPNTYQSIMGAFAPPFSDWDVRTRLASILESLELPFRFRYSFDCDVEKGNAAVHFELPSESALPAWWCAEPAGNLEPLEARSRDALMCHALRLSCQLASACFGAGRCIGRAFVVAYWNRSENVALSCSFERDPFVRNVLTAIDDGSLADPASRFDSRALASLLSCASLVFPDDADARDAAPADDGLSSQRVEPWLDERPLDAQAQSTFRARRICDIDTTHYYGPGLEEIEEAKRDSVDSTLAAIAQLENLVARLGDCAEDRAAGGMRALYCANPFARAVISLVDDDVLVSAKAESFIHGDLHAGDEATPFYFRAPSALYHAHMGLSDLYETLGDFRGAEREADACIALAPTTASAHFRKANLLAQQKRYVEAANVIRSALQFAVSDKDCSLLYYHLGLLLWNLDRKNEAAAVFVFATTRDGEYADRARKVVKGLKRRSDCPVIVHASTLAAARELTRSRIPVAPTETAMSIIAHASVELSCNRAPLAAAPFADMLVRRFKGDRVLAATYRSLAHGTAKLARP